MAPPIIFMGLSFIAYAFIVILLATELPRNQTDSCTRKKGETWRKVGSLTQILLNSCFTIKSSTEQRCAYKLCAFVCLHVALLLSNEWTSNKKNPFKIKEILFIGRQLQVISHAHMRHKKSVKAGFLPVHFLRGGYEMKVQRMPGD